MSSALESEDFKGLTIELHPWPVNDERWIHAQRAALGMLARYSRPAVAEQFASDHACSYAPDSPHYEYWRNVGKLITAYSRVRA